MKKWTDLWSNIKQAYICMIGGPEEEEREKRPKKIVKEIIAEYFPNIEKEIFVQVQEAQSPTQDKPKEENTETHSNQMDKN